MVFCYFVFKLIYIVRRIVGGVCDFVCDIIVLNRDKEGGRDCERRYRLW